MRWQYAAGGFFQGNRYLLEPWLQYMRAAIPEGQPRTAELFCGSGLIGGYCRDLLGRYSGCEFAAPELNAARTNFKERNWSGTFHKIDLYRQAPDLRKTDLILANPPRAGLRKELCAALGRSGARHMIYSSCNPATLNRDLGLLEIGGFQVRAAAVFDFFPRTPHLEVVAILGRS